MEGTGSVIRFDVGKLTTYNSILIIIAIICLVGYFLMKKMRMYLRNRTTMKDMAKNYNRKRKSRNELKFHYYWALDRGEHNNAANIGRDVLRMDEELRDLYEQYYFYKEKGFHPMKKI